MSIEAETLGFVFSRIGCPCNGSPRIYTKDVDGSKQKLTIWEKRNTWRLEANRVVIATGTASNLTTKIKAIWDL